MPDQLAEIGPLYCDAANRSIRQYIDDTRPLLIDLNITVPANRLNRRFL